jgi:hypothetical protein
VFSPSAFLGKDIISWILNDSDSKFLLGHVKYLVWKMEIK